MAVSLAEEVTISKGPTCFPSVDVIERFFFAEDLNFYLSRLFARCWEFGLLARCFDHLVPGKAVGVLRANGVVLLSQHLTATPNMETERRGRLYDTGDLFKS